jgi:dolichyl-diphosphooligosaccharide--protein glycosyltransferase
MSASYFAGVMVRLMLTLTPVVCVLAAIAFSAMVEIDKVNTLPGDNFDRPAF